MLNKLKLLFANTGSRRLGYFFLSIIIILSASLYLQKNKMEQQMQLKVQFIEQKNMLRDELDDIIDEHDDLLDEYGELNKQLHEKDSLIQEQIAEIRNLIRTKSDLKEARRKIETLKSISKKYIANIDSLLAVNEVLAFEKDSVIKVNKNINWKNYKLNKQNADLSEKVSKGSVLEVLDVKIKGVYYRSTGNEKKTEKAKKVQKIRIYFTVAANQISDAETKTVYMQIINENGELIQGNELLKTVIADSTVECTSAADFEYNNIEMTHDFEWERVHVLLKGTYLVNLIIEGNIAAQTTLKLR